MKYVFDGVEVLMTGRIATRSAKKVTRRGEQDVSETVIEIYPAGSGGDWKRWVKEDELFQIIEYDAPARDGEEDDLSEESTSSQPLNPMDNILQNLKRMSTKDIDDNQTE